MSPIGKALCRLADVNATVGHEDFRTVAWLYDWSLYRVQSWAINIGLPIRGGIRRYPP